MLVLPGAVIKVKLLAIFCFLKVTFSFLLALHETLKETLATRLKSHSVKGCLVCNDIGKPASNSAAAVETSPKRSPAPKDTATDGNGDKNRASITEKVLLFMHVLF